MFQERPRAADAVAVKLRAKKRSGAALLAKRLCRASPKTAERMSSQRSASSRAKAGHLNERGKRFNPAAIKAWSTGRCRPRWSDQRERGRYIVTATSGVIISGSSSRDAGNTRWLCWPRSRDEPLGLQGEPTPKPLKMKVFHQRAGLGSFPR
jgi:hypothetical protein